MKIFLKKILMWCSTHIWQTIVISISFVSCVSAAIVLPIVLKNEEPRIQYEITFDMQGHGEQVSSQTIDENCLVLKPANPTCTGYEFKGWYKESTTTNIWNFDTDVVSSNLTLFAKWDIIKYEVSFVANGESYGAKQTVNHGLYATKPATDPVKEGYTFAGWYDGSSNLWDFDNGKVEKNTTLTAKWEVVLENSITIASLLKTNGIIIPSESTDGDNPYNKGDYEAYASLMKEFMNDNPEKELYFGYGINIINRNTPTAKQLDDVCSYDIPIVVVSENGHECWLNTAAIKKYVGNFEGTEEEKDLVKKWLANFDENSYSSRLDPSSLKIPTGYFSEAPCFDILERINVSVDDIKNAFLDLQEEALINNVVTIYTSVLENNNNKQVTALKELADEGKLKIKFSVSYEIFETKTDTVWKNKLETLASLIEETKDYNLLDVTSVRITLDGIIETLSCYVSERYPASYEKDMDYKGVQRWRYECTAQLNELVYEANKANIKVEFNATGDAAIKQALDACEYAKNKLEVVGTPNFGNAIIGCYNYCVDGDQIVESPLDTTRFIELGVSIVTNVFSVSEILK